MPANADPVNQGISKGVPTHTRNNNDQEVELARAATV
jgi:hypothetical protein